MSWLKSNTYHHSDFADLEALCEKKKKSGQKISLCIPTLNEESTIGKVVVILKSELMDRFPLIDEIAVIDSGSDDKTGEVATSFGAEFYYSGDIMSSTGFKRGKGENLWKAIHQLSGDIIAYVDADIANIHPRFVYGLIGPLLEKPEVSYVKAFYERPLAFSQGIRPTGGGRVTEILVRPLFSLFYPELAQLFQPLSGEYAVRRETLENIPFPIGYGVETSHILDVYKQDGMNAFAQVDLDQRVHRNQDTNALGKMSFGILQSFLGRLQDHGKVTDLAELSSIYRSLQANGTEYEQIEKQILEEERPPINTIPEYLEKYPR